MSDGGKGDSPRPVSVDQKTLQKRPIPLLVKLAARLIKKLL